MQMRIARPAADLDRAAAFYRELVGLPVLGSFEGHDGFDGVIFGLPDASRQLELVHHHGVDPAPTAEDQLVLYLAPAQIEAIAARLAAAGVRQRAQPNPFWERNGAACFVDPDGYWLVLAPSAAAE